MKVHGGDINFDSFLVEHNKNTARNYMPFVDTTPFPFDELSEPSPISSKEGTPERKTSKI